jgi:Kef-type K+ transport system membrane component KefB
MIFLFDFTLPLKDPVLIFSIVLFVILLAPIVLKRFKIPGIIGLILAGTLLGPYGINLLLRSDGIVLFGTVGLLYIMFLAGLEIDLNEFKKNRNKSLVFGLLTFSIPMLLGTTGAYYLLELSLPASILLASMFASHTLLAYPIVSSLGVSKNEAATIAVGGTMITDTLALLVLAVIIGSTKGELNADFWLRLGGGLSVFAGVVLFVFPIIARWFFRNMESEGVSQYIFSLAVVFASAFGAELAGVEPIIGAFLAGLALNRLIPHSSPLMNRIEFVGNALFIPFFLISVGMLINLKVLFNGVEALKVAGFMILTANSAKWMAAFATQKIFGYSRDERNLIFGLSNAQAAATLAAVLVGYNTILNAAEVEAAKLAGETLAPVRLLNESILNGTILMILVTCLVSSFAAEKAARKLAVLEKDKMPEMEDEPERILVPISNPETMEQLIDLAILLKNPKINEPIYALSVVRDDDEAKEKVVMNQKMLEKAARYASATDNQVKLITRVDLNVMGGIKRVVKEMVINQIVIGWNGKITTKERLFGSVLDNLLTHLNEMIMVTKFVYPVSVVKKIVVVAPPNAEKEVGFGMWLESVKRLSKQINTKVVFFGENHTLAAIKEIISKAKPAVEASYKEFDDWEDFLVLAREVSKEDLFITINARHKTISHESFLDKVPRYLSKHFDHINFIIIYPEQNAMLLNDDRISLGGVELSPIQENIERIQHLGKFMKNIFVSKKEDKDAETGNEGMRN